MELELGEADGCAEGLAVLVGVIDGAYDGMELELG
jgi:hypothetical protein